MPARGGVAQEAPRAAGAPACELVTAGGLRIAFEECGGSAALGSARAREIEIVEYRNGDARIRARVADPGQGFGEVQVRALAVVDPDDDGDGLPTAAAARRPGGRMKVGRVTLRATGPEGIRALEAMRRQGDLDRDGFPMAIDLRDEDGGQGRVEFQSCTPAGAPSADPAVRGERVTAPAAPRGTGADLTLECRRAEMVRALDANPYARLVTELESATEPEDGLMESPSAQLRGPRDDGRRVRLRGAVLRGWSLEWPEAGAPVSDSTARWTLEVRVDRIEMA